RVGRRVTGHSQSAGNCRPGRSVAAGGPAARSESLDTGRFHGPGRTGGQPPLVPATASFFLSVSLGDGLDSSALGSGAHRREGAPLAVVAAAAVYSLGQPR